MSNRVLDVDDLHCPGCNAHQLQNCNCTEAQIKHGETLRYIRKQQMKDAKPIDMESFLSRKRREGQARPEPTITVLSRTYSFLTDRWLNDESLRMNTYKGIMLLGAILLVWWA